MRLTIFLEREERQALLALADIEKRKPSIQAALIIRRELERKRLLPPRTLKPIKEATLEPQP